MSGKLRILVVDDNEEFCQNVVDILELKGYEAVAAYDGFTAMELVERDGFDLVLMDIKMPVMDGVAAFRKIKEISPGIQVIMVTAYSVENLIRDALREGAFGVLSKPLDFDELFDIIERATAANGAMILVADDDENTCANLRDVLVDRGYRVSVACDGSAAIERVRKNKFDIMLLDLKLPPVNGLEVYLSVRDIRPEVVVIVITGYRSEMNEMVRQITERGAYICLEKPVDMDELVSLLERIEEEKAKGTLRKPG